METNKILTANLLDIVFDGRNKTYGAYELRTNYETRMIKALFITSVVCIAIAGGAWLKSIFAKTNNEVKVKIIPDVTIATIKEEKPEPPPLPPPPATKVEVPKIKSIEFTTPIVTHDKVVTPPPSQSELIDTKISNITQDGIKGVDIVTPPEVIDGKKGLLVSGTREDPDEKIFKKVEVDAQYAGNWKSFLERNLNGDVAVDNGATPGKYTVMIQFVVDVKGNVSGIQPLTSIGFGMEQEAMRVIKKSGKWKPAIQNGQQVKAYKRQPITFQVMEQ